MQVHIILGQDSAFTRAQEMLGWLWNHRKEALHEIEIREYKADKTRAQEKFYWGYVVTPFADAKGYTPEEMHKIICATLYGTYHIEHKGLKIEMLNRTTTTEKGKEKKMNVADYDK